MTYSNKQVPLLVAIVVLILKSPFLVIGAVVKNKALLIIVVIAFVAFIGISAITSAMKTSDPMPPVPEYQRIAPTKAEAPTVVATGSRIYYVSDFTQDEEGVTLLTFFVYNEKEWEKRTVPLRIDRNSYGIIKVYPR